MKCHQCNQDSIEIDNGHIICEICGLDIDVSFNLEEDNFFDLFFYNKNLDEANKLGIEAYSKNMKNPYSTNADQVALNSQWEKGYSQEKLGYDYTALSLSSEKIESELRAEIEKQGADLEKARADIVDKDDQIYGLATLYKDLRAKIKLFLVNNDVLLDTYFDKLCDINILGRLISNRVNKLRKKYKKFSEDSWDFPGE